MCPHCQCAPGPLGWAPSAGAAPRPRPARPPASRPRASWRWGWGRPHTPTWAATPVTRTRQSPSICLSMVTIYTTNSSPALCIIMCLGTTWSAGGPWQHQFYTYLEWKEFVLPCRSVYWPPTADYLLIISSNFSCSSNSRPSMPDVEVTYMKCVDYAKCLKYSQDPASVIPDSKSTKVEHDSRWMLHLADCWPRPSITTRPCGASTPTRPTRPRTRGTTGASSQDTGPRRYRPWSPTSPSTVSIRTCETRDTCPASRYWYLLHSPQMCHVSDIQ